MKLTAAPLVDIETRTFPDRGEIVGWANSSLEDAHRSVIPPEEVIRLLSPENTRVDIEHSQTAVPGVKILDVWTGKRSVVNPKTREKEFVTGVGVRLGCDLAQPESAGFYRKFEQGLKNSDPKFRDCLRGLSIGFHAPEPVLSAWRSGKTKTIAPLESIPWLSGVRLPSNSGADVMEMRSAIEAEDAATEGRADPDGDGDEMQSIDCPECKKPVKVAGKAGKKVACPECKKDVMLRMAATSAADKPLPAATPEQVVVDSSKESRDVLAQVRQKMDAEKPTAQPVAASDAKPAADPAAGFASPSEPIAAPAGDSRLDELSSRVAAVTASLEELRARPQSKDWETGMRALEAQVAELRTSLQDMVGRVDSRSKSMEARSEQIVDAIPVLLKEQRAWVLTQIDTLKVVDARVGNPGDIAEIRMAEELKRSESKSADAAAMNWEIKAQALLGKPV